MAPPVGSECVEELRLDPDVIVEPLQVPQVGCSRSGVGVQVGSAVSGDLQIEGRSDGGRAQPFGDLAAAGHVCQKTVDGVSRAHVPEVGH